MVAEQEELVTERVAPFVPIPYAELTVGVIKETAPLERRVAQSPDSVAMLTKAGFKVVVESGAGALANFPDEAYTEVGAEVVPTGKAWGSDIVLKIRPPTSSEAKQLGSRTLISLVNPRGNPDLVDQVRVPALYPPVHNWFARGCRRRVAFSRPSTVCVRCAPCAVPRAFAAREAKGHRLLARLHPTHAFSRTNL